MRQILARGVSFKIESFTDPSRADLPVASLSELQDALGLVKQFPIVLSFKANMSEEKKIKRIQQNAAKNQRLLESLQHRSPAPHQTINEKLDQSKLRGLQLAALARLSGKEPEETRKSSSVLRSSERVKQQALASQQKKTTKQNAERLKGLKDQIKDLSAEMKPKYIANLLKCLRQWWAEGSKDTFVDGAKFCLKASQELDDCLPLEETKRKRSFCALQEILRICGGPRALEGLEPELVDKLGKLARKHLNMPVLAAALGSSAEKLKEKKDSSSRKGSAKPKTNQQDHCPFRFQLGTAPEHLARPVGAPDERVRGFNPDVWQAKLLDVVDAGQSALVQAPTGSGKTFIAFYVMERILRTSDDGVVVYVCPTKALANQVYAEVQARFSKIYQDGRPFCGIFTRDKRSEHCLKCQVLVTVPQCLIIYMLSPDSQANAWVDRLQYAIVDEVHELGGEGGSVWEQVLSLLPCPLLALSATLGQSEAFTSWLQKLESARGRDLHMVKHVGRFNDLQSWVFDGEKLGPLHPFFALQPRLAFHGRLRPESIHLIPEDSLKLWDALGSLSSDCRASLAPETFFASSAEGSWNLSMMEAQAWSTSLGQHFDQLDRKLQTQVVGALTEESNLAFRRIEEGLGPDPLGYLEGNIGLLAEELRNTNKLPAICFHNSRLGCEVLADALMTHFTEKDAKYRKEKGIDRQIAELRQQRAEIDISCLGRNNVGKEGEIKLSADERDAVDEYERLGRKINLLMAIPREFILTPEGQTQLTDAQLDDEFSAMGPSSAFNSKDFLHRLLLFGIGVHHAGLPAAYRQVVERLFRMQRLGIVVSTSTLALGINMPSKTSVFAGSSIYLSSLQFQQEAGRAGRRGFDLRGHIVFFGLPSKKVQSLLLNELPMIQGNYPLTASLALRLAMKAQVLTDRAWKVAQATERFLCPFFCPSPQMPLQQAHLLQFFMKQFFSEGFLASGQVTDYAGFVAHIWWQEPGNFAFVSVLQKEGLLKELCQGPRESLVAVLCHFFFRMPLADWWKRKVIKSEASLVVLPELPAAVAGAVQDHSQRMLQAAVSELQRMLVSVSSNFMDKLATPALPFSKFQPCSSKPAKASGRLRSPFVALSGYQDNFKTFGELCDTVREDVHLDLSMFPVLDVGTNVYLNAYLLDFYRHGQTSLLERDNKIPHTEHWQLLYDFMFFLRALASVAKYRYTRAQHRNQPNELGEAEVVSNLIAISAEFEARFRSIHGNSHI